ncbi:tryptophan--tRNA ligase [Patescibacteria group bacterium]
MNTDKKILLSGVKPTGRPHIGNYFGAMKQFVDLQDEYDTRIFVANYHALTTLQNKDEMEQNSIDVVIDYLAIGLDLQRTTIFLQSDVPEVTELAWVFNCITTVSYLERAHAFKDAKAKKTDVNVGTFDYPILQAADILSQDADVVPVGQDQKQHIEMTRDIAEKFNRTFGETFKLPEPMIVENVAVVPGTDGQKMSKSYGNTIPLFAEDDEIKDIVAKIPMDSKEIDEKKNPDDYALYNIYKLFADESEDKEMRAKFENGGVGYGDIKKVVSEKIIEFITPLRERREEIAKNVDDVMQILKNNGEIAKSNARKKIMDVRDKVGFNI